MKSKTLAKYKSWADDLLYRSISELPESELKLDRAMLFGNILSLLHHVYAMDIVWKSHLEGTPHNLQSRNPDVCMSFNFLRTNQSDINAWYESYFANLGKEQHTEKVEFTYIGSGDSGTMSRGEIMQHVANHASYHRGHIEGVLYQMSIEPPTTDIPVFLNKVCYSAQGVCNCS